MYRPLDVGSREIRVLEILPPDPAQQSQNDDSTVAVRLRYCSLNSPISYEALSYIWGDPNREALIRLNSTENVSVRRNLEKALRDLRFQDGPRLVWIDALCINQADVHERREQVKLMRSIYAAASVVRTWIDLDIDCASAAFFCLHSLSDDASVRDLGEDPELWGPVGKVLANEYWCRIWVQQEIAYAAQWTVQCHSSTISSRCLMIFATLLVLKEWGFFTDPLLNRTSWKALMPSPLRPLLYQSRKDDGNVSSSTFYGPLHRALRDCRNLKSTDPKDKVFAMLGMIDDYHDGDIDVNYGFSDEQVYTNMVRLSIERYRSLDFLREATLGNLAQAHADFPSWLPDWSVTSTMDQLTSPAFSVADLYPESNGLSSAPASITRRLLNVSGCQIATVASVLPEAQQENVWCGKINISDLIAKLRYFKTLVDGIDVPVPEDCTALDQYYSEYFFRAITGADGRNTEQLRFRNYSKMFHKLIHAAPAGEDDDEAAAITAISALIDAHQDHFGDIVHYMQESCRGRHLILTDYLGMGLVPLPAAVGDEIWYVLGCPTPMTLRNEDGRYLVVGEAYLNDCMRWRIVDRDLETSGGIPLPDYPIQDLKLY
jgi:Heterokaryon incompatibility protein (HET)